MAVTKAPSKSQQVYADLQNSSGRSSANQGTSSPKQKVFKKVVKYFQDQALDTNRSALYLSPANGREPQQYSHRGRQSRESNQGVELGLQRRFSEATTFVSPPRTRREPRTTTHRTGMTSVVAQKSKRLQYASENILQSYDIYIPEREYDDKTDVHDQAGVWMIYIHGGYFRDVTIDSTTFQPAIAVLEEQRSAKQRIKGYVSINYRLAPRPAHPQDPEKTPNYEMRNAKFPDQLDDVLAALKHLDAKQDVGGNYVLAGHSVGATLAFLAALKSAEAGLSPPQAVLGVSGIYDFPQIHTTNPDYEPMTHNAMRPDQYKQASPATYSAQHFETIWTRQQPPSPDGVRVVLAHSRDDGLVEWGQVERMQTVLESAEGINPALIELSGMHDDIWRGGNELAKAYLHTLDTTT